MTKESNNIERCSCTVIHKDIFNRVKKNMPKDEILYDVAELFKVLGDTTRTKIICALFQEEMCVCDLANLLGITQSAVSHQLKVLKHTRLVKPRREGKIVFYSLDDDHIKKIFDYGFAHITEG